MGNNKFYTLPKKNVESNPFVTGKNALPMIAAHRGGGDSNPELLFIVETKNSGDLGYKACKILNDTLSKYTNYLDQIVVGTFHDEIETELKAKYPNKGIPDPMIQG